MLPEKAREGSQATKKCFLPFRRDRKPRKSVFCPLRGVASRRKMIFAPCEGSQATKKCFLSFARGRKPQKNDFCPFGGVASGEAPASNPVQGLPALAKAAIGAWCLSDDPLELVTEVRDARIAQAVGDLAQRAFAITQQLLRQLDPLGDGVTLDRRARLLGEEFAQGTVILMEPIRQEIGEVS